MSESDGALLRQCVVFCRLLRSAGLPVTPAHAVELAQALAFVDIGVREEFRWCAQAILVSRREQRALFDELFDRFWRARERGVALPLRPSTRLRSLQEPVGLGDQRFLNAPASDETRVDRTATYSATEVLRHKDFAALDNDERAAMGRLMARMRWQMSLRRSRRFISHDAGRLVDLRRTLHNSLRRGGEALTLARRQPKDKPRPLVVLCDVSGSMQRYSCVLLQFLYAMSRQPRRVEVFVFSTRLSRITRQLRDRTVDAALDKAVASVTDWGGGTRIGAALHCFNQRWAPRVLRQSAVVLLVSDGWERGDAALLAREMARLQRHTHRLIWLNPLLGAPDYQPSVRGMQAALPHLDDFLPVHNLASLEQLVSVLRDI